MGELVIFSIISGKGSAVFGWRGPRRHNDNTFCINCWNNTLWLHLHGFCFVHRAFEDVKVFWQVTFNTTATVLQKDGVNLMDALLSVSGATICTAGHTKCFITIELQPGKVRNDEADIVNFDYISLESVILTPLCWNLHIVYVAVHCVSLAIMSRSL